MLKLAMKSMTALGLLTFAFMLYIVAFYLILNTVIRPYERDNAFETHTIRPVYNVVFYPMRKFIANGSSFKPEKQDVYFGTLVESKTNADDPARMRSAEIDAVNDKYVIIGFTGKKSILEAFDRVDKGQYVRLVFGQALPLDSDRFINRLISFEVIDLMEDPRIFDENLTEEEEQNIFQDFSNLKGGKKICMQAFLTRYKDQVLQHCLQARYANNIGGGCYHLAPYSISGPAIRKASEVCNEY